MPIYKIGKIQSICCKDIEQKQNSDFNQGSFLLLQIYKKCQETIKT